jgi:hypothetical protein
MAFLEVGGTVNTADTTGPVASNLVATNTTINAHISDLTTGGSAVTAAEYSIDGASAVPLVGTFGAPEVDVSATFAALGGGSHTVRVRGQDQPGNWGPWARSSSRTTTSARHHGLAHAERRAGGDGRAPRHRIRRRTGGSNVTSAEYTVGGDLRSR